MNMSFMMNNSVIPGMNKHVKYDEEQYVSAIKTENSKVSFPIHICSVKSSLNNSFILSIVL
jgi:hypothetical protein